MKIERVRLERRSIELDPPFDAAWDPKPRRSFEATIVLVETDEGLTGIGSGDTMDGFERYEHLFVGQDPLADRAPRRRARDDHLPRRPLLAPGGGALGSRRKGRGQARRRAPRRTARPRDGLCLDRRAALARRARRVCSAPAGGGIQGAEASHRPDEARRGPGRSRGGSRGRGQLYGDHGRPEPGLADAGRHRPRPRPHDGRARRRAPRARSTSSGSRSRSRART